MHFPSNKRFLKVLLWLIYVVVLLQLAVWIYFKLPSTKPIGGYGYPRELFIARPGVGYGYKPDYKGFFSGGDFNDITIDINQDGFRDKEFSPKPPETQRILFLGDSVVFGAGVQREERFTSLLEESVEIGKNIKSLEVLNLGVNAYAYRHYNALLKSPLIKRLDSHWGLRKMTSMKPRGQSSW